MSAIAGKVRSAPEDVQDASIDRDTAQLAERLVHFLRVLSRKILDALQAEVAKVLANTRSDARNHLEFTGWLIFCFHELVNPSDVDLTVWRLT